MSENAVVSPRRLPSIAQVIEKVGMGPTQLRFTFTGGGVWFADGAELLLCSAVTNSVAAEWGLNPAEKGSLVTMVYIGVFVGNVISGPISDLYGRYHLILLSYLGIFAFSMMSSFMVSFWSLCFWRFFVGFAFGYGQPPWNVLASEVTPGRWRIAVNGISMILFSLGEVYSSVLIMMDDPYMKNLRWRRLLQLGAIPSVLFLLAAFYFLKQSPFFLARFGQNREAREVLETMQRDNYLEGAFAVDFEETQASPRSATGAEQSEGAKMVSLLTEGRHIKTTAVLSYSCFVANLVFYGALYAFPQVLPHLGFSDVAGAPSLQLLIGALWEIPGIVLAIFLGMCYSRKPVLKLYCFITCLFAIMFVIGAGAHSTHSAGSPLPTILWRSGYYGLKCFILVGFVVLYIYITEVYPTSIRTTGTSICFAFGRVAAIISPMVYEGLLNVTGTYKAFFYLTAGSLLLNLLLIDLLPLETFSADEDEQDKVENSAEPTYGATEAGNQSSSSSAQAS